MNKKDVTDIKGQNYLDIKGQNYLDIKGQNYLYFCDKVQTQANSQI